MAKGYEEKDGQFVGVVTGIVVVPPGDTLNVRYGPSIDANILAKIDDGAEIDVQGEEINGGTKWLLINAGNKSGWVRADYVKLTDAVCVETKESK